MAPQVKTLDAERIRSDPLRIPQQPVIAVDTSGLSKGLLQSATALEKAELQLSQIRLSDAEADLLRRWNSSAYEGDGAYFNSQGEAAVKTHPDYLKSVDEDFSEVQKGLTTNTEKRLFRDLMLRRREQLRVDVAKHAFDERQEWDALTAAGNIEAQRESAANNPAFSNVDSALERVKEEAATIARIKGVPADSFVDAAVSDMLKNTIEHAMTGSSAGAAALMDRYGPMMLSDDRTIVAAKLKDFVLQDSARAIVSDLTNTFVNADRQIQEAERMLGGKNATAENLEVLEEVRRRLTNQENQRRTAELQVRSDNFREIAGVVFDGARGRPNGTTIDDFRSAPGGNDRWNALSPTEKAHIQALEAQGTTTVQTNWDRWLKIGLMSQTELAAIEPMNEALNLHQTEMGKLTEMVKEAQTGDPGFTIHGVQTPLAMLTTRIGGSARMTRESSKTLVAELTQRMDNFARDEKRNPTPDDVTGILDDMFLEVGLPGTGLFSNRDIEAGLLEPGQEFAIDDISDVPRRRRNEIIIKHFAFHGVMPSDQEVINAYVLLIIKNQND